MDLRVGFIGEKSGQDKEHQFLIEIHIGWDQFISNSPIQPICLSIIYNI